MTTKINIENLGTPYFYSTEKINFEVDIVKWILEKKKRIICF